MVVIKLPTKSANLPNPGIRFVNTCFTFSKFAISKPKPITNAPTPVEMMALFKLLNAFTTVFLMTAPKFLNASIDPITLFKPSDKASADCTFKSVFCTFSPSTPTNPNAP